MEAGAARLDRAGVRVAAADRELVTAAGQVGVEAFDRSNDFFVGSDRKNCCLRRDVSRDGF